MVTTSGPVTTAPIAEEPAPPPPAEPPARRPPIFEQLWFQRSWWTAAGIVLLMWAFNLLTWVSAYSLVVPLIVVVGAWGIATLFVTWMRPRASGRQRLVAVMHWGVVVLALASFAAWAVLEVLQAPGYGTDEMAFDQYAAHLLTQGINPYTHSMAPAFPMFHVQPDGYTYQLDGTAVTTLSYPALSFLLYVPALLLGAASQVSVAYNVVAWMVAIVVMLILLPKAMRPMALVIGSLSVYAGFAVGGVTVALYVPLLAGAVYAWHRWPDRRGWRAWVSPVLMGLAMCINQVPWFVFPFVVIGIGIEAGTRRSLRSGLLTAARYVAIAVGVALVPNLPFIVWDAHAWVHGILTPILRPTVPAGQGLVALALYAHLGGGTLKIYSVLSVLAFLTVLVAFAAHYPRLRPLAVLLPAVPLLLNTRSYGSYLFGLVPAALVAAVTTFGSVLPPPAEHAPSSMWRWRRPWQRFSRWGLAASGLGVLTVAAGLTAVIVPAPLSLQIKSVTTTGQLATVQQVSVLVHNRSHSTVHPNFTLNAGDAVTTFWVVNSGPRRLQPGQSATYTLLAPNFPAQPAITGGFQVVAFTTSPAAVSHSDAYLPSVNHVSLNPDAVNQTIPIGKAVVLRAELLDRLNRPVHRAGVPIYLGQAIYAQAGLEYGNAIINSGQTGQSPISALTNADGVATFTIRGTYASTDPVSFEANLVNAQHFYPFGYSEIVPIRFGK